MIKIAPITFKNNYEPLSNSVVNKPITNSYSVSFGQNKYDFFEKGMSDNKEVSSSDNKYSFLESEQINVESKKDTGYIKASDDMTLADGLAVAGIVGVPFVLSIAMTSAIAKASSPEDIFLPDGTYFCNAREFAVKSSNLEADGDDGILKIKGTGIDIDKSRYDAEFSNPEKGIFKSADGKLDIDLLHNKYIDEQNGIIVNPEKNIAAMTHSDGKLHNVELPNFGSGYPTNPWTDGGLPLPSNDYGPLPIVEKIKEFFHIKNSDLEDALKAYDISVDERLSEKIADSRIQEYINDNDIDPSVAQDIVKYAEDIRLKEYMIDYHPTLADNVNIESIDSFINNLHHNGTDYDAASGLMDIIIDNDAL